MSGVDVCTAVAAITGRHQLAACQRTGNLWRIYVRDIENRVKLLATSLNIRGQTVSLYNDNPYRVGISDPEQNVTRITIKGYPFSKSNATLKDFLVSHGAKLTSEITLSKYRDPVTKELLEWYNGDRIAYAESFEAPLPRMAEIASSRVMIFHDGQQQASAKLCTNCYQQDHFRKQCKSPAACRACRKPGHSAGDLVCEARLEKPREDLRTISGTEDPLSNFYQAEIDVFGIKAKTAEHAYQYSKAIRRGDADTAKSILEAKTPLAAKRTAQTLKHDPNWASQKEEVMSMVLKAKANQVEAFTEALLASGDDTLVETVNDIYWGSGFNAEDTKRTKEEFWLGKNRLGTMLKDIRSKIKRKQQKKKQQKKPKKAEADNNDRELRSRSGMQSRPGASEFFDDSESELSNG